MSATTDLIDMSQLAEIMMLDDEGSNEFTVMMMTDGFKQIEDAVPQLYECADTMDYVKYFELSHYLKGPVSYLGLKAVAAMFEQMSECTRHSKEKTAEELPNKDELRAMIDQLVNVRDITKQYLIENMNFTQLK